MDFFQNIRVTHMFGRHHDFDEAETWESSEIEEFINNRLNIRSRIPGRIITEHYDAYFFWRDLIQSGELHFPFKVDHIDAHADLGAGNSFYLQLLNEVMHSPCEHRNLPMSKLDEGNYLLFALANQWISELKYIHHPLCNNDIPLCLYKDFIEPNDYIQLVACNNLDANDSISGFQNCTHKITNRDLEIPFQIVSHETYKNSESIDFINIARSPGYATNNTIQKCLEIFNDYIMPV